MSSALSVVLVNGHAQQTGLFSVTIIAPTGGNTVRREYASIISSNMISVGIDAKLFYVNFDQLANREFFLSAPQGATFDQGGYDIGFTGWGFTAAVPDFRGNFDGSPAYLSPVGQNYALYNNSALNSLLDTLYSTTNVTTQLALTHKFQEIVFHDAPYNYIYEGVNVVPRDQQWSAWGSKDVYSAVTFPDLQHWSGGTQLTLAEAGNIFPGNTLDPGGTSSSNSFYVAYIDGAILGGSLQEVDGRNLNYISGTAENITASPDHLTWTITLRPGVLFQDGVEVTADDFVFTQYALTSPQLASVGLGGNVQYLGSRVSFTFLNETTRVDDNTGPGVPLTIGWWKSLSRYTFQFHLPSVYAFTNETYAASAPLPMHIMEKFPFSTWDSAPFSTANGPYTYTWDAKRYGSTGSYTAVGPVGAGPYILQSYDFTNNIATLVKFPQYWNATGLESIGQFTINTYKVAWISSKDSALAALKNGEVNLLDFNYALSSDKATLEQMGVNIISSPELGWQEMGFNMRHPVFGTGIDTPAGQSDPSQAAEAARDIRKAISHLIPRDQIVNQLLGGAGYPLASFLGPGWGKWYDPTLQPDSYDPNAAADLLREAGYTVNVGQPPSQITYDGGAVFGIGSITIKGTAPVAHMMIILQQSTDGISWRDFAGVVAANDSTYSISVPVPPPFGTEWYRANFTGYVLNDTMAMIALANGITPDQINLYVKSQTGILDKRQLLPELVTAPIGISSTSIDTILMGILVLIFIGFSISIVKHRKRKMWHEETFLS
ncbi:MAG TPA: ABC transporter substrate-binding protein [Candidatus Bathyarchaeia archaeon]|nr:ABC transporter substrate-binding protein [Candidatus Bathyarchaeia archaeon]